MIAPSQPGRVASQREVARRLGVSHTALQKAAQAGRIAQEPGGGWDVEKVRARLAASSDPARKTAAMVAPVPAQSSPPPAPPAPPTIPHQEIPVTTTPASTPPTAPPEPTRAVSPAPDLDAIRAEAERATVERIAGYEPVLAAARGLVSKRALTAAVVAA
jgi:hypothetical protein